MMSSEQAMSVNPVSMRALIRGVRGRFGRTRRPRTAFVLSGGASLGALQVGMLRALFERGLVGGGVVNNPPASHGIDLGAERIYVLPTHDGSRALPKPPRGALDAAIHGITLLIDSQLRADIARYSSRAELIVLPAPNPRHV